MALTKAQKQELVSELTELLGSSKMTVVARYKGVTVKSMQNLRREAKANGTKVKVYKNRLVRKALADIDAFKDTDTSALKEMLLYAFNKDDEVAAAQVLNTFGKNEANLEFVGAISSEGQFVSADDVKALALLPSKNELIAQVIATAQSPLNDVTSALSGDLHGLLDGVGAKATA